MIFTQIKCKNTKKSDFYFTFCSDDNAKAYWNVVTEYHWKVKWKEKVLVNKMIGRKKAKQKKTVVVLHWSKTVQCSLLVCTSHQSMEMRRKIQISSAKDRQKRKKSFHEGSKWKSTWDTLWILVFSEAGAKPAKVFRWMQSWLMWVNSIINTDTINSNVIVP